MEENVALDSSQQKQFVKSVRGIKKLLKKKSKKAQKVKTNKDEVKTVKDEKKPIQITKAAKIKKRRLRGLVYLSHIPHGFYEPQMTEYFKQFGVVTNVRVIRSKRTGNSKGFAFVEFKEPSVAEIVAETMNNYLMGKRLIKAVYIPPKEQKMNAFRKNWNNQNNPATEQKLKIRKAYNATKTDEEELKIGKKLLARLSKTKEKLSNLGIDYDFFKPVDVPEALKDLANKIDNKEEDQLGDVETKSKKKTKTDLTKLKVENNKKKIKLESNEDKIKSNKQKFNGPLKAESDVILNKKLSKTNEVKDKIKLNKKDKNKICKIEIKDVKPLHNFISIKNDDDNSDSDDENDDFDSDEFEQLMENDEDDDLSSGEESDEEDIETNSEDDQSDIKEKIKQTKKPIVKNVAKTAYRNAGKKVVQEKVNNVGNQLKKRKNVQSAPVLPKKAKFEKQNKKKPLNKVLKKKK